MKSDSRTVGAGATAPVPVKSGGGKTSRHHRTFVKYRFIAGFLAIPLGLYAVFVVSPFVQTFYYSLTNWTGFSSDFDMIGLENFSRLLEDDTFWDALTNNLILLFVLPPLTLSLGLFFAFMLNVGGRHRKGEAVAGVGGSKAYKILYFFPQALSIAIIAVLWQNIYAPRNGLLNGILPEPWEKVWLANPDWALWSVMFVMSWAFVGFYVVLFSAAMGAIPKEIYESALLDGANRFVTFFRITLPLIRDTVQTGWVYMGILALGNESFAVVNIMTQGPGGPENSTMVLGVHLYNKAFRDGEAGYATAVGVALCLVTITFAVIALSIGRRREPIEY